MTTPQDAAAKAGTVGGGTRKREDSGLRALRVLALRAYGLTSARNGLRVGLTGLLTSRPLGVGGSKTPGCGRFASSPFAPTA